MNMRLMKKSFAILMAVALIVLSIPFAASAETVLKPVKNFRVVKATSAGKLELEWNKVKNADGYEVYRCAPGETEMTLLTTVTKKKFVGEDHLNDGSAYKYQIRPFAIEADETVTYGEFSKTLTAHFVKKPTSLKVAGGLEQITVHFETPKGAKGIQIYMKAATDTKYKRAATITSGKEKYIITGLLDKTTYSVKVRAYWKAGGKTFYTSFTSAKNVTTK